MRIGRFTKLVNILFLIAAVAISGCSGGGSSDSSTGGTGTSASVSLTGVVVSSGQGRAKSSMVAPRVGDGFKAAIRGASKGARGAGVMAAQVQLYDAEHPEWTAPIAAAATDNSGAYSLTALVNASINGNAYVNGDPIPAGLYTLYVTYRDPVSGSQMTYVSPHVQQLSGSVTHDDIYVTTTTVRPEVVRVNGVGIVNATTMGVTMSGNSAVEVVFSQAMEPAAVRRMTITSTGGTAVSGTWLLNPDWKVATFTSSQLALGNYQINIPANVNDIWLNRLATAQTIALTVTAPDTTAPRLVRTEPASTMALGDPIVLYFNEQMNAFSIAGAINSANPSRSIGSMPEVTPLGQSGTDFAYLVTPSSDLLPGNTYEVMITGGTTATDLAGNVLMDSVLMTFTVDAAVGINANTTTGGTVASTTQESQVARVVSNLESAMRFGDASAFNAELHVDFLWQGVPLNPAAPLNDPAAYDANQDGNLNQAEASAFFRYWIGSFQNDAPVTANAAINWISVDSTGRYAQVGLDLSVVGFSGANLGPTSIPGTDNIILGLTFDPASGWSVYDMWDVSQGNAAVTFQSYFNLISPANLQQVAANGQIDLSWNAVPNAGSYLLWIGDMWGGTMLVEVAGTSTSTSLTVNPTTGVVTTLGGVDLTNNFPMLAGTAVTGRMNITAGDELWWQVLAFNQTSLAAESDATLFVTTQPMAFSDWFTFNYGTPQTASFTNVTVGQVNADGSVTVSGIATPGSAYVDIFVYGMTTRYYSAIPNAAGNFSATVFLDPGFINTIDMYDSRGAFTSVSADASGVVGSTYVPVVLNNGVPVFYGANLVTNGVTSYVMNISVTDGTGAAAVGAPVHVDAWGYMYQAFDVVTDSLGNATVTIPMTPGEYIWVDVMAGSSGWFSVGLDNTSATLTPVARMEIEPNDVIPVDTIDASWESIGAAFGVAGSVTTDVDRFALLTVPGGNYDVWTEIVANNPDTVLTIFDAAGMLVASNDDTFGLASWVNFTDTGAGPYVAEVRAFGGMVYQGAAYNLHTTMVGFANAMSTPTMLELEPNDVVANQLLVSGDIVGAGINPVGEGDRFDINLTAGMTLILDTEIAAGMDTTLELFDAGLMSLAFNDDWNGLASHIQYVSPINQTVTVEVRGFANIVGGNYNLIVTTSSPIAGVGAEVEPNNSSAVANPVMLPSVTAASLTTTDPALMVFDEDWYVYNTTPGAVVNFSTRPTAALSAAIANFTAWDTDTVIEVWENINGVMVNTNFNDDFFGLWSQVTHIAQSSQLFVRVSPFASMILAGPAPLDEYELVVDSIPLYKATLVANKASFASRQAMNLHSGAKVAKPSASTSRATKAFRQKLAGPAASTK